MTSEEPVDTTRSDTGATGNSAVPGPAVPAVVENSEQFLLTIGDIGVSRSWIVTPNGTAPLKNSQWIVMDQTRSETRIPPYAIVLAIVFFLACLIGLLFLLIKQTVVTGHVEVSVRSGSLAHVTQIPASDAQVVAQVRQRVQQAQTLAAQAPAVTE